MSESDTGEGRSAAELITARVAEFGDWRGETLARICSLVKAADASVSLDLLVKSLFALGASRSDVGRVISKAA